VADIHTVKTNSNNIPSINGTALDFDITTDYIWANKAQGLPCLDKKAVVKLDKLHAPVDWWVVGKDYKAKSHKDYFTKIEEQLIFNMDPNHTAECEVKTKSARNGRWGLRDYVFPQVGVPIVTKSGFETTISLRIVAWSGLDGSSANNFMLGAIDSFCTNGQVFTQAADKDAAITSLYKRNSKNFNLDLFAETLMSSVKIFYHQAEQYQLMADKTLGVNTGLDFIKNIKSFSKAKVEAMQELFMDEVTVRGNNLFALHSAFTNYSSHMNADRFRTRKTKYEDVEAEILFKREEEISNVLNSNQWNELLAA